jgi:signal transduction histidine kinase
VLVFGQPPRSPPIEIDCEDCFNDQIRFGVRDNDDGLTTEEQASLFVAFQGIVANKADGHGLGLAIVQRIHLCGGTVGIESTETNGSYFNFTFPHSEAKKILV